MSSRVIFVFWLLCCVGCTTQNTQNDILSIADTRTLVDQVSEVIITNLEQAKTGTSQMYVASQQYITPYFTYQILPANNFKQQLEDCYLNPGFLLYNPALIDQALHSFPREFYIANFNTELLLSKTPEQFLTSIDQATQDNECSIVVNSGTTYQIRKGECSQNLKSVCIIPVTDFSATQYSNTLVPQLKQDMQPIIDVTIETLGYLKKHLTIAKPLINEIGAQLRTIGVLSTEFAQEIQDETPSVAHFFKIVLISHRVQQALNLNTISQLQVLTTTQEQAIQQTIQDLQSRRLDSEQTRLLEQQQRQAQSLLQQLEKATKQLYSSQTEARSQDEDSDESESGLSQEETYEDLKASINLLSTDIEALKLSLDSCEEGENSTSCLFNETNNTVLVWPTNTTLTFGEIMEYSIYNFYAAVTWSLIMFITLLTSCCYTKKQSQQIRQLQRKVKLIETCHCPNAPAAPSSSSGAPLLNKRKLVQALNSAISTNA